MRIVLFYHSLVSDWNHGNAHFLRGVTGELIARGHDVRIFEPRAGWSRTGLLEEHGEPAVSDFETAYPQLRSTEYDADTLNVDEALDRADLVIVHEWNSHALVKRIGLHRRKSGRYSLLFHDTHHRLVTDAASMAAYDLSNYDGVLAFGDSLTERYRKLGIANRAWTWHEAADTRIFRPFPNEGEKEGDLVWIGNWGDEERTSELREFLLDRVRDLLLTASAYGVRYPESALRELRACGLQYRGWAANYNVPSIYSKYRLTVHIPRRPYVRALPGVPTIRVFEALACGIPLICSPWNDCERLFCPGEDFLVAQNGAGMKRCIHALLADRPLREHLAERGRRTILARHTCAHRVDELLSLVRALRNEHSLATTQAVM